MITVASIPRCGSTMLWRALNGLPPGGLTPKWFKDTGCGAHGIKKLHAYEEVDGKVVFLFGDIINSVISTKKNRFNRGHFKNCGYGGNSKKFLNELKLINIYETDFLGYEKIFDLWTKRPQTALVRYEKLHDNMHTLCKFLGKEATLPPQRERRTGHNSATLGELDAIKRTYASLILKIERMSDYEEI